ncbi:MAG: flavin reductase family protein [Planctomycetes bacterium]|nr:flavin reductase family protein [Planctomycetota bacterium]
MASRCDWTPIERSGISDLLDQIPSDLFLLTGAYGEMRGAALVRWVQQVASNPPMLVIAIEKGQPLSPIIRDSRGFALCLISANDPICSRLFRQLPEHTQDPLISIPCSKTPSGAPVPTRATAWFDCEIMRHFDIEADHEVYIGCIHHAGRNAEAPIAKRKRAAPAVKAKGSGERPGSRSKARSLRPRS